MQREGWKKEEERDKGWRFRPKGWFSFLLLRASFARASLAQGSKMNDWPMLLAEEEERARKTGI